MSASPDREREALGGSESIAAASARKRVRMTFRREGRVDGRTPLPSGVAPSEFTRGLVIRARAQDQPPGRARPASARSESSSPCAATRYAPSSARAHRLAYPALRSRWRHPACVHISRLRAAARLTRAGSCSTVTAAAWPSLPATRESSAASKSVVSFAVVRIGSDVALASSNACFRG